MFGSKIIKNVMKNHLLCIIVSSRVKIVGLLFFLNLQPLFSVNTLEGK